MALREVLAHFGVEVESEHLEKFDGKISEITEKLKLFGEVIAASIIGEKMHEFIENQIHLGAELQDTAERLGVTTDELQKFQFAAQLSGASAEAAVGALSHLNRSLGGAVSGSEEAAKAFASLHIEVKETDGATRPAVDVLADLADRVKDLDHVKATAAAVKLLGRGGAAMVPMLRKGSESVRKLYEEFDTLGGGMTKEFAEAADDAENATTKLKLATQGLKSRIAMELLPAFKATTERMTHWIVNVIKIAKQTYVLRTALMALKLGAFVGILIKIKSLMAASGMTVMDLVKAFFKFGPILILVGLLYLLFDDFYTLMQGGDSVIGDVIDTLFGVGAAQDVVNAVKSAYQDFIDYLGGEGGETLQEFARIAIGGLIVGIDALITSVRVLGNVFKFAWDAIAGNLTDADKDLDNMGKAVDGWGKRMEKVADWSANGSNATSGRLASAAAGPRAAVGMSRNTDVNGAGGTPMAGGRQPMTIEINNHISGVNDPKAAGEHAGKATKAAMKEATEKRNAFAAQPTGG